MAIVAPDTALIAEALLLSSGFSEVYKLGKSLANLLDQMKCQVTCIMRIFMSTVQYPYCIYKLQTPYDLLFLLLYSSPQVTSQLLRPWVYQQ